MSDIIIGRNSVYEYLNNLDNAKKLYLQKGLKNAKLENIVSLAEKKSVEVVYVDKKKLDDLSSRQIHQGVVLLSEDYKYYEFEDLVEQNAQNKNAFLLILDEITDPHNLGAIIRTAEAAGVDGIIIPKRRAAQVNYTVHKTSAGATSFMKVSMVTNINQSIEYLKKEGYWIYGADGYADKYFNEIDYSGKIGIVIGNEGRGISKLTKSKCDDLVKIPMFGRTESLNASNSAAILIYGILSKRGLF